MLDLNQILNHNSSKLIKNLVNLSNKLPMGNQSSVEEHDEFKNVARKYTFEKKYTDNRFGEIKLLRDNSSGIPVFQKDISCNSKGEYELISKEIKERSAYNHPNSLKVLGFVSKKEDLFCADFFKISLFFESFDEDLEQIIFKKKQTQEYFQEVELWYIFDSLVSVLAFFQENKLSHGDIRTFNIFTNSAREYKIADLTLFKGPLQPGYFGLFDPLESKNHYPGPELLKALKEENSNAFDRVKNDVFSLGLTMLEIANLKSCNTAYNWDELTINEQNVLGLLDEMKDRYTETLIQTIKFCLNINEADRPDFLTLDRELAPYRVDIRARVSHQQPSTQIVAERLSVPVEDDLDTRIRVALRKSEETISRSSPSKKTNKYLDPYIYSFMNSQPIVQDKPLLQTISPYLSADNKYTMTLTQYPAEGENLRGSQFVQDPNIQGYPYDQRQIIDPKPLASSDIQSQKLSQDPVVNYPRADENYMNYQPGNYQPNYLPPNDYQNNFIGQPMPETVYTPMEQLTPNYQTMPLTTSVNNYNPNIMGGNIQYGVYPGGINNMGMPEESFGGNNYQPSNNLQFEPDPNAMLSNQQEGGNTPINTDALLRQVEENLKRSRTIQK